MEKEAHLASYEEIKENDFNLNIPRYVDATEKEPPVRLSDVNAELKELNAGIAETSGELKAMLGKLQTEDKEMAAAVCEFMNLLEDV